MLILTETKLSGDRAKGICMDLPFDHYAMSEIIGHTGGIWILWRNNNMDCQALNSTEQ